MRSRLCTVALQCLIPQTPFPKPPAGSRRGRNGGGRFLCIMRGMRLVLVALVSANVAFFHAGCRFERTTARCAVETRKWGRETASFSAAIKGRGEGTSPVLRKKWRAIFQKSTTFVRNTWSFAKNFPVFWRLVYSARTKGACPSSTLHEGENRCGRIAWFSPAHEIYNAHKAPHEDYFFREVGPGRQKKGFFPRALVTKCDA